MATPAPAKTPAKSGESSNSIALVAVGAAVLVAIFLARRKSSATSSTQGTTAPVVPTAPTNAIDPTTGLPYSAEGAVPGSAAWSANYPGQGLIAPGATANVEQLTPALAAQYGLTGAIPGAANPSSSTAQAAAPPPATMGAPAPLNPPPMASGPPVTVTSTTGVGTTSTPLTAAAPGPLGYILNGQFIATPQRDSTYNCPSGTVPNYNNGQCQAPSTAGATNSPSAVASSPPRLIRSTTGVGTTSTPI